MAAFLLGRITYLIGISMLALALSGCASGAQAVQSDVTPTMEKDPTTTPEAVSHGNEIGGYVELVDALRAAGATVEPTEEIEQAFFSLIGQKILVNEAEIQVFEYADEGEIYRGLLALTKVRVPNIVV